MFVTLGKDARIAFQPPFVWRLERRVPRRMRGKFAPPGRQWRFSGVEECGTFHAAYEAAVKRGFAPLDEPPDFRSCDAMLSMILSHCGDAPPLLRFNYFIFAEKDGFLLAYWPDNEPIKPGDTLAGLCTAERYIEAVAFAIWHRTFSAPGEVRPGRMGKILFNAGLEMIANPPDALANFPRLHCDRLDRE